MTPQTEQPQPDPQLVAFWQPKTIKSFDDLCQNEGFNPVRLRRLVDDYLITKRKPSRQQLVDSLKHRPRIQARAAVLGSVTKKLYAFIENFS